MGASAPIRNIIFDLGGVIIDLDIPSAQEALTRLGIPTSYTDYSCELSNDLFLRYETGRLTTDRLREELRLISGATFSDEAFDRAWCKMLSGLPAKRVELLHRLNTEYRTFLLSNTSPLHALQFEHMFMDSAGIPMKDCFEKRYYSFETGLHKPDAASFMHIVSEKGIVPEETLFIDDTLPNIQAAARLGFRVIHLSNGMDITDPDLFASS